MDSIENIELVWSDDGSDHIFSKLSTEYEFTDATPDIKLDVLVGYKKTALSEIVNYLMSKIELSENNNYVGKIKFFLSNVLLLAVYPKATKIKFSDENNFRDIIALINDDYGDQYINKSDLEKIPEHSKVINMLVNNKLLKESTDRYTVIDYYLKNLKLLDKKT